MGSAAWPRKRFPQGSTMELELDTQSYNSLYYNSTHLVGEDDEDGALAAQHWLAGEGPYRDHVKSLRDADPRLRQRDPKAQAQNTPWLDAQTRFTVLDLEADSTAFSEPKYFTGAQSHALEDFLADGLAPPSGLETQAQERIPGNRAPCCHTGRPQPHVHRASGPAFRRAVVHLRRA